ncbi:MAG TPA: DEAD/DEAH box helicase [Gammaproteobacteria bacterium]|nr:DEAD/DEAH box helicase [Gammaproteobacteria bacterium]
MQAPGSPSETPRDAAHLSDLRFEDLELSDGVRQGIAAAQFSFCTPIQAQTLPIALSGRDVAGQAQTGTGKTAAYLIAMFEHLEHAGAAEAEPRQPRALILAPTRELAIQIHSDAQDLGGALDYRLGLVYGGVDYEKQRKQLEDGVDVLIGTPGRLIDYFKQKIFHLRHCRVMILDEADRMFDLGFIKDIRYILRRLPPHEQRQNMLFSATLSHRVLELAYEHMNDPELIRVEPDKMTVDKVRQSIYFPANDEKIPLLVTLLRDMQATRTMVFVNTKRAAERLFDTLEMNGIQAAAISGDVPQRKRQRMLSDFQEGKLPVLIATDVASRGLHVPAVSHVFNFDLPQDAEDYVHRIGRTARAGASGDAISFGCEDYVQSLPAIEEYIGRKIPVEQYDHAALREIETPAPRRRRPRGNKPPAKHKSAKNASSSADGKPRRRRRKPRGKGS